MDNHAETQSAPQSEGSDDVKPPYAPFPTFKNFVEKLRSAVVPHRIDKSVMANLSGAAQSQVLNALRFLRLTEPNGNPTSSLLSLVESFGTPMWGSSLHGVLSKSYESIVDGLDLNKATLAQLSEAFRAKGKTDGSLTEKAIRFYLKATEDAGVKLSPHFGRNTNGRAPARRRKATDQPEGKANGHSTDAVSKVADAPSPLGMISFPIHLPGKPVGRIVVPDDIELDEVEMVEAQIAVLRLYAKRKAGNPK